MKQDIYEKITNQIITELENGVRPWMKPWNAEHAAGRITNACRVKVCSGFATTTCIKTKT